MMKSYAISNVGYVRRMNEDSFLSLPQLGIFAVADGMGGHQAGEIASKIAVDVLEEFAARLAECPEDESANVLVQGIHSANMKILQEGIALKAQKGMGTTLSALVIKGFQAFIGHVGDSRVYLVREQRLTQLTADHSVVAELVRMGQLTEEQAREHPNRNMLSRALGMNEDVEIDALRVSAYPGDVFLLTSDGVTNLVEDAELGRLFVNDGGCEEKIWSSRLETLSNLIMERGANDNFTLVCCVIEGNEEDETGLLDQPTHPTLGSQL